MFIFKIQFGNKGKWVLSEEIAGKNLRLTKANYKNPQIGNKWQKETKELRGNYPQTNSEDCWLQVSAGKSVEEKKDCGDVTKANGDDIASDESESEYLETKDGDSSDRPETINNVSKD
eukprot:GFUD01104164.1.p1 GENE.GFUD01104164.1~~GFUD01104164.1.p1  ORF type:complete len:118 (-),score=33.64 GFUD01104164.1:2-355(-)